MEGSTVWLTICTPPACSPTSPLLNNTRQTSRLPVVVIEQLRGRTISMQGLQRTRKLHMIREYLLSEEGRRWHTVVYADALDVIAGTGSEKALRAALRRVGAVDEGQLVASAEPACWLGEACSDAAVRTMRRLQPEHFSTPHAPFPCSGQYAGGRTAVLRYVEWAIAALEQPAARTPIRVTLGDPALDDQGLLIAYWLSQPPGTVLVDGHCRLFCPFARWFVLDAELQAGRASPHAERAVPWCGELAAGARRFSEGVGYFCSDAYNLEGFRRRCGAGGRCDLAYAEPNGGAALRPLLGWHGPGHNGKTLFRPLWKRLRTNHWSAATNASALTTPKAGVCAVTSVGEGDCRRGWWGSWRASDYGISLKGVNGQAACLSLCRQCARCAYVSWSAREDECAWYAQCTTPLQHVGQAFQSVAAPWSLPPPSEYNSLSQHSAATNADKTRGGEGSIFQRGKISRGLACQPRKCASIEAEANCSFALTAWRHGGPLVRNALVPRRSCSPHVLRQHAPTTTGRLQHWLASCAPGCHVPRRAAAAEAEAARGASDEVGARACRPLAGGQPVYLWAMVSVMQNDLLSHFLQHYAALGVDLARRATFVLHVPPGGGFDASANATRALMAARGVDVTRSVTEVVKYTTIYKKLLANAHLASLPADALLVYPDVDEFFEYPCDVLRTLATGSHHATCATMVDRLGSEAVLSPLRPSPAIEQQFTMCAEVRGGVLSREACLLKITLLPTRIRGAVPRFATSHRATTTLPSGATLTVGGCQSWGEACLFTGGFAHYQFYEQSVHYQISKIKTHLDAGDRKNAKVYKEYASVFKQSGTNGKRFSFDALMFDQVMRYRVSCRHWVCPACATNANAHTAGTPHISA